MTISRVLFLTFFCVTLSSCGNDNTVPEEKTTCVDLQTNFGTISLELYPETAPVTVENFMTYVNEGFYSGTIFHRVIPNFMIQGGGYTETLTRKTTYDPIVLESGNGLSNTRGTIAMARTTDPNSATSQFYINVVDNTFLDRQTAPIAQDGYAVFGSVTAGMQVADTIVALQTYAASPTFTDVPVNSAVISGAMEVECKQTQTQSTP